MNKHYWSGAIQGYMQDIGALQKSLIAAQKRLSTGRTSQLIKLVANYERLEDFVTKLARDGDLEASMLLRSIDLNERQVETPIVQFLEDTAKKELYDPV